MPMAELSTLPPVDIVIRTFNSEKYLSKCISSAILSLPINRILIIDHHSTDRTAEIGESFGAEIHSEDKGLGYATTLGASLASTKFTLFLDGDVIITRKNFYREAIERFDNRRTAAVVGVENGHPFIYGLPLGLTLFRSEFIKSVRIPDEIQGRETYFIQRAVSAARLKVRYVKDSMTHDSIYRSYRNWPEWQGAQIRNSAGLSPHQLIYSFIVILLMHMNSRKPKNILYTPIFYIKLLRGFFSPVRWGGMDRRIIKIS
ncbi:MAG: glycosyltransferase family 2 protein [Thermoplasmata archaeon]|nr:glycosyltransferase family 2 protein [Candidatus Sysuiplasma acidicola]